MTTVHIKGTGNVVQKKNNVSFPSLHQLKEKAIHKETDIQAAIKRLIESSETTEIVTSKNIVNVLSREEIEALERQGIVTSRFNKESPYGGYALSAFKNQSSFFQNTVDSVNDDDYFRVSKVFHNRFGIITGTRKEMTADQIQNASFENIPTNAQIVAICTKNTQGEWEWEASRVFPDGMHVQAALTATEQYAQSCFEGLVAMVNEESEIIVFRPNKNAERMINSCQAIAIPPMLEDQFIESVKYAILANKKYLPKPGSNAKMYIRPYMKGLEGGYGVGPANSYAFVIEVFPFGDYIAKRESIIHIVGLKGKRRSCEGGMGAVKVAGNYAPTMVDRENAKKGELDEYPGQKFSDTFYFGEAKVQENGQTIVKEVLEEDSAGNLFFIKQNGNKIQMVTPSLQRKTILPGFTRASLIHLSKYLGYEVIEKDHLTLEDIKTMRGAFLTGSAAGMVRVGSMTYDGETIHFDQADETASSSELTKAFFRLYDALYQLRKGHTDFVDDSEMKSWPFIVGNI